MKQQVEDEITYGALAAVLAVVVVLAGPLCWSFGWTVAGFVCLALGIFGLLRAARHFQNADRAQREEDEYFRRMAERRGNAEKLRS